MTHYFDRRHHGRPQHRQRYQHALAESGVGAALAFALVALVGAGSAHAISKFPIATGSTQGQLSLGHVAFDGTNYLVGIQGDAVDRHNVSAQLVSQSGTLVGPLIATGHTGGVPGTGFLGTNHLLVWADDATSPQNQLYGQFISPSGSLVGEPVRIGPASGGQELNAGAFDGTNSLIVWHCREDQGICTGIHGQMVSPAGALLGSVVTITESGGEEARVAFDGDNYLVVWHGTGLAADRVMGRFVSRDGTLVGSAFVINASPAPSDNPGAVAFNGTNYLVVWPDEVGGMGSSAWHLFGQLVTPSGALSGGVIPIATAAGAQLSPSIAVDGTTALVTWTNLTCDPAGGTCADVYGQYLSRSGTPVGPTLAVGTGPDNQMFSAVTFAAGRYLVAWNSGVTFPPEIGLTGGDVFGTFLEPPATACVGDCDTSGSVTVDELVKGANIALGKLATSACPAFDSNSDDTVTVEELVAAANRALQGCEVAPLPLITLFDNTAYDSRLQAG